MGKAVHESMGCSSQSCDLGVQATRLFWRTAASQGSDQSAFAGQASVLTSTAHLTAVGTQYAANPSCPLCQKVSRM